MPYSVRPSWNRISSLTCLLLACAAPVESEQVPPEEDALLLEGDASAPLPGEPRSDAGTGPPPASDAALPASRYLPPVGAIELQHGLNHRLGKQWFTSPCEPQTRRYGSAFHSKLYPGDWARMGRSGSNAWNLMFSVADRAGNCVAGPSPGQLRYDNATPEVQDLYWYVEYPSPAQQPGGDQVYGWLSHRAARVEVSGFRVPDDGSLTLYLTTQPTGAVDVRFSADDPSVVFAPPTIRFEPSSWQKRFTVKVNPSGTAQGRIALSVSSPDERFHRTGFEDRATLDPPPDLPRTDKTFVDFPWRTITFPKEESERSSGWPKAILTTTQDLFVLVSSTVSAPGPDNWPTRRVRHSALSSPDGGLTWTREELPTDMGDGAVPIAGEGGDIWVAASGPTGSGWYGLWRKENATRKWSLVRILPTTIEQDYPGATNPLHVSTENGDLCVTDYWDVHECTDLWDGSRRVMDLGQLAKLSWRTADDEPTPMLLPFNKALEIRSILEIRSLEAELQVRIVDTRPSP